MNENARLTFYRLSKTNMPPVSRKNYFILWRAINESGGGIPAIAKHVQYDGAPAYIRYVTMNGWKTLDESEYRSCLWAPLEMPEQITRKMERRAIREQFRNRRNEESA